MSFEPFQPQYGRGVILVCSTVSNSAVVTGDKMTTIVATNKSDVFIHVRVESLAVGASGTNATTADYCVSPNGGQVTLRAKDLFGRYTFTVIAVADSGTGKSLHLMPGSGF